VSDRPFPTYSRQAAKRFRRRGRRLARRLLDQAYAEYLRGLTSQSTIINQDITNNENSNNSELSAPSPLPPSSPQSPPHHLPSPPRSPTPPLEQPDSPHSAITLRLSPDSPPPPSIRSFSPPSYSPISSPDQSPRPSSPADSTTSSVEFIEELHIPPPRPRRYYNYNPHQPLDVQILQFPLRTTPLLPGSYFIGPAGFDLSEIRTIITGQDPDSFIPVFLPTSPFPREVPVRFFYNLFPPSTAIIRELN